MKRLRNRRKLGPYEDGLAQENSGPGGSVGRIMVGRMVDASLGAALPVAAFELLGGAVRGPGSASQVHLA